MNIGLLTHIFHALLDRTCWFTYPMTEYRHRQKPQTWMDKCLILSSADLKMSTKLYGTLNEGGIMQLHMTQLLT